MAKIRKRTHYADYRSELAESKALRQGAMEDAFWDEDELVDYPSAKKKKPRERKGCPGNGNKAHVYVWVIKDFLLWSGRVLTWDVELCCGCDKRRRSRH